MRVISCLSEVVSPRLLYLGHFLRNVIVAISCNMVVVGMAMFIVGCEASRPGLGSTGLDPEDCCQHEQTRIAAVLSDPPTAHRKDDCNGPGLMRVSGY